MVLRYSRVDKLNIQLKFETRRAEVDIDTVAITNVPANMSGDVVARQYDVRRNSA
jgi:hypothetical protein